MEEDLSYFNAHVWAAVDKKKAESLDGFKLVRMRWVICNKGDENEYDIRARLVAREINTYKKKTSHPRPPWKLNDCCF